MFESVEVGERLDKETYESAVPALREALLEAEFALRSADFSVVVVIAGSEAAGKGETVNCLLEWLDARGVETHAMSKPNDEEKDRPPFFRFWRRLPPHGKIGIFFGSWYTDPIVDRISAKISDLEFESELRRIVEFERLLANEKVLVIKIWLHITKKQQKRNLKALEDDPTTAWRVTKADWAYYETYEPFIKVAASAIRQTSKSHAQWHLVEAADWRHRNLNAGKHLLACLEQRLSEVTQEGSQIKEELPNPAGKNLINALELDQTLDVDYQQELASLQARLGSLARRMTKAKTSAVLVFEGSDGAGKGGCIRRISHALDARFYQVIPIAAPTDEERARPYLWRFWRTLPKRGHINIFDRSWYGRVLVERIEGLCTGDAWRRGYSEINAFEEELSRNQVVVIKFWLAISSEEQLQRFKLREQTGFKRYKLTEEDWRNREKSAAYEAAACDMIAETSTSYAPWVLVEANNKRFARIKVLRTVCQRLEEIIGP